MRSVDLSPMPDELYKEVENLARVRGTTVADVVITLIARTLAGSDEREERLMAEIRARREELARRGFVGTAAEIQNAKVEGRP
jgi:acetolactate synthase small subunit